MSLTIRVHVRDATFEAPLPDRPITIGRRDGVDLKLLCDRVGSDHCVLEPLPDGRLLLRDLASGYPTRVNGIEAHQVSVRPGDVIEVGEATLELLPEATVPVVAAPPDAASEAPTPQAPDARAPSPAAAPAAAPAGAAASPGGAPHTALRTGRGARASSARLVGPLIGLGAAALVAIGIALFAGGNGHEAAHAAAERRLDEALDLYRAQDYPAAKEELEALVGDRDAGAAGRRAGEVLQHLRQTMQEADDELSQLWDRRLDVDLEAAATAREVFLQQYGRTYAKRYDEVLAKIKGAQTAWVAERTGSVAEDANRLIGEGHFAEARAAWEGLRRERRVGGDLDAAIKSGLEDVEKAADAGVDRLLKEAAEASRTGGAIGAYRVLKPAVVFFQGLRASTRVTQALADVQARMRAEVAAGAPHAPTAPTPRPVTPGTPTPKGPAPATPTPAGPATPGPSVADDALAQADQKAAAWAFADGARLLDPAIAAEKDPATKARLEARKTDLSLAAAGLEEWTRDITANSGKYGRIELSPHFFVSLLRADAEGLVAAVTGGETRYRWTALSPAKIAVVAERAHARGRFALDLAALLREVKVPVPVDGLLVDAAAGEDAVPSDELFRLVARWRGEALPEGGAYVVHGRRWVTPKQHEHLLLLERIADLCQKVRHKDDRIWTAAVEDLISIGPEASDPLRRALLARRGDVIDQLAKVKALTSSKAKLKLYAELQKRRAYALALIEDSQAWPYPNPSNKNTDEVVARVDAVRQVWERPFDVVAGWSADAKQALESISRIDGYLVRVDASYKPSLAEVRDRVNHEIDMPTFTPDAGSQSLRQYSLKVLAYNEKVDTTSTPEEKDCVRAVNEYRMMMGRQAVKINERLVRAARGHSKDMREKGYFAHEVPADKGANDENRDPGARARRQGYSGGVGENIARGTFSGRDAFAAWFHSSGHHRNMINKGWTEMGAGRSGGDWWTQVFGAASGRTLEEPDPLPAPEPEFAPEPEDPNGRPKAPSKPEVPSEPPPMPGDEGPDGG